MQVAAGHARQEITACQPAAVTEPSEVNLMVRQPDVDVIVPGEVVPVYVPIIGEEVLGPSYIYI